MCAMIGLNMKTVFSFVLTKKGDILCISPNICIMNETFRGKNCIELSSIISCEHNKIELNHKTYNVMCIKRTVLCVSLL